MPDSDASPRHDQAHKDGPVDGCHVCAVRSMNTFNLVVGIILFHADPFTEQAMLAILEPYQEDAVLRRRIGIHRIGTSGLLYSAPIIEALRFMARYGILTSNVDGLTLTYTCPQPSWELLNDELESQEIIPEYHELFSELAHRLAEALA